jgi:diguanylate cyclase (GGDEF)-like protein/hemerythrin-like metal-binding protein
MEDDKSVDFRLFEESFQQITELFDFLVCGVVLIDEDSRRIVYANSVAKRLSLWEDVEIIGGLCHEIVCPAKAEHCPLLDHHQIIEFDEKVLVGKLGNQIPILKRVKRIEIGNHPYILESFTDIRAQKDKLMKLETLHETDTLTGLPNRASLERMVNEVLTKESNEERIHTLIMVDLDLLKSVNDTYGHQAGDEVLREFSAILKDTMRKEDVVFRWGGDEFLIFARNTESATAIQIAERLRKSIADMQFTLTGKLTASFGVAQYRNGETFEKWFRRTDFCLTKAKKDGRNRVEDWDKFLSFVWQLGKIPWVKILESGNANLDDEHRYLLSRINNLFGSLNSPPSNKAQLDMVSEFVMVYQKHMLSEEKLFQETEFPLIGHHINEHQRIHLELSELKSQLQKGTKDYFSIVDYVVREVFVYHMTMEDTKFFPYLKTRES